MSHLEMKGAVSALSFISKVSALNFLIHCLLIYEWTECMWLVLS